MLDVARSVLLCSALVAGTGCSLMRTGPRHSGMNSTEAPEPGNGSEMECGPPLDARGPAATEPEISEETERLLEHTALVLDALEARSYSLAAQETQRLSVDYPGNPDAVLLQVLLERRLAQLQSSASAALTASKHEAQARALIKEGRNDDARLLLERAHALDRGNAQVVDSLASLLKQMGLEKYGAGDATQAAALWRRALEVKPGDEEARRFLKRAEEVREKI